MNAFRQFRATPNLLTMLRLFILPFLVITILDGHWRAAFALLWLAGVSDGLDGLLARWLQQRTTLGQYLDPIADKLLLSTLFIVLTHVGLIPRYVVTVLVFSRDLGILLIATLLFATNTLRDFRPQPAGQSEIDRGADPGGADRDDVPGDSAVRTYPAKEPAAVGQLP